MIPVFLLASLSIPFLSCLQNSYFLISGLWAFASKYFKLIELLYFYLNKLINNFSYWLLFFFTHQLLKIYSASNLPCKYFSTNNFQTINYTHSFIISSFKPLFCFAIKRPQQINTFSTRLSESIHFAKFTLNFFTSSFFLSNLNSILS